MTSGIEASEIGAVDLGDHVARKGRGAFFTPAALTRFVCDWAIQRAGSAVLEPSCGDGSFLVAAASRLTRLGSTPGEPQLVGYDIHADSVHASQRALARDGQSARLRTADFFTVSATPTYDAVIGNPPFVRYQDFTGEARSRGRQAALSAGVGLTALASSWAAFVVHAAQFVRPGGRLGLVLPAELLTVNYAAAVRSHLLSKFRSVQVVVFAERIFPGALEEVVLLLADGADHPGGTSHFDLHQATSLADLAKMSAVIGGGRRHTPALAAAKWNAAFLPDASAAAYADQIDEGTFCRMQQWGETTLGAVTGNNDFFAMTPAHAQVIGLRPDETRPISPPGSRHLRRLTWTTVMSRNLGLAGARTLLFRPGADLDAMSAAARNHIAEGERAGVHLGYKTSRRRPWWQVPLPQVPDLFVTYMNADTPRLAVNNARAHHLNSVHGLYLRHQVARLGRSLLAVASVNTMTMLGAELVGRSYGGGILKLEPKEADELPVPSPATVYAHAEALRAARPAVRAALSTGRPGDAAHIVDDVLFGTSAEAATTRGHLRAAHGLLADRRAARSASARR